MYGEYYFKSKECKNRKKDISQLELSAKTGISVRCIKYYEALTRIPSLLNAYKLSETLETPITELFPYSDKTT